jgi:two-component system LytT family response regulator
MKKIKCIVVDDEQGAIDILTHYILKTPFLEFAGSFLGPLDALDAVYAGDIDLIFLDIHMPELSGLDFIKLLKGRIKIVLTTAYHQYALEGYEHNVVDYLLKPIPFERFLKAAQKVVNLNEQSQPKEATPESVQTTENQQDDYVFVKADGKVQKVKFEDILYIEGLGNYVTIHTVNGKIVTLLTMKEVQERLPESMFMRVHRSCFVSLGKVQFIEGNKIFVEANTAVSLGETYREPFFKALEEKMLLSKRNG